MNYKNSTKDNLEDYVYLYDRQEKKTVCMTIEDLLLEINRDRLAGWIDYTIYDWVDGLEFTDYEFGGGLK